MSALAFNMVSHISTLRSNSYAVKFSKVAANHLGLSRTIDHINLLLRSKGDQQFSHSLRSKRSNHKFGSLKLAVVTGHNS